MPVGFDNTIDYNINMFFSCFILIPQTISNGQPDQNGWDPFYVGWSKVSLLSSSYNPSSPTLVSYKNLFKID